MELRQLRTFTMAAELQSFTRAAEAMSVTQPAVSQQIRMLEHELGTALFERRGRGVALNDAGWHLYEYARKALDILDQASREMGATISIVTGTIRIASCTVASETFLPEVLAAFRRSYPDVLESVNVSDTAQATRAVETGAVDVGFVVVPP